MHQLRGSTDDKTKDFYNCLLEDIVFDNEEEYSRDIPVLRRTYKAFCECGNRTRDIYNPDRKGGLCSVCEVNKNKIN